MVQDDRVAAKDQAIHWRDVPTYLTDGPIGSAWVGELHRIVLGEFVFNPEPDAPLPAVRPVANLVMSTGAVRALIDYLETLPGVKTDG